MSSAPSPSVASTPTTFTAAWELAKTKCLDGLSDEDKNHFLFSTADDARVAIKDAQVLYDNKHQHGKVWGCINALVAGLESYGSAMDVFVNTTPLFLAPIWGTIRVFMKAISNLDNYVTKVLDVFGEIGDNLSRFQLYGKTFPAEAGVQSALVKVYVEILQFCIGARHVLMLRGGKKGNLLLRPFHDHAFKALWHPFETQFKSTVNNFQRYNMLLENEVRAASTKAATTHYDKSEQEHAHSRNARDRQELADQASSRRRLFTWLNATAKNQDAYHAAKKLRHDGTCQWLMQHRTFVDWQTNARDATKQAQILWISGIPGRGKTVLCSCLIEHLKPSMSSECLAYFFCSKADQDLSTSSQVGRSLVSQLLAAEKTIGVIYDVIVEEYDKSEAEIAATAQTWSLLRQISRLRATYLVLDGFDECVDHNDLLMELKSLGERTNIIVFSRALSNVWPKDFTSFAMEVENHNVAADISAMVKKRIDTSAIMSAFDPPVRADLESSLINKADGMFLWTRLVLEQVDDLATFNEVRDHIDRTPSSVSAIYRVILEGFSKLPSTQQARIMKVLRWAVASRRPLSIREISDAIVLKPSSSRILDDDRILQIERVLHQCDPLLHVNTDTKTVHLCHYSLREFLFQLTDVEAQQLKLLETKHAEIQSGMAEELGKLSLRYLALEDLPTDWDCVGDPQVLDKFPLLRYATDHWLQHILEAPAIPANVSLVDDFLQTATAAVWLKNFIKLRKQQFGRNNAGSILVRLQSDLGGWRDRATPNNQSASTTDVFGDLMMKQYLSLQQRLGPQDPATLEIGFDLCEHYSWIGRTGVAEDLLASFLKGKPEPNADDNDPFSIQGLPHWLELSRQKMMNGKLLEAEVLGRKVFEARQKRLGPASFETCEAAALLADIRTDLGKLDEAEDLHRLALDGLIQSRGELDLDTLREFNNFGNCLKLVGKLDEAASMLRKAYEGRNAHYGPKNQSTLRALDNLGTVLLDLGKVAEARKAHGTALEGMRELLGDEDLFTSRAALNLAVAQARAGEWSEATELAGSAVLSLERTLGTEHIDTLKGAAFLGTALRQTKQEDMALRILKRTSDLAMDTLEKTHFVVATCEKELAVMQPLTQTPKTDDSYRQKSFQSILRKKRTGNEEAMGMLRRFKVALIAVVVIVLLMLQWVLKSRLRRVPALHDTELVMKEREHGVAPDSSGGHV